MAKLTILYGLSFNASNPHSPKFIKTDRSYLYEMYRVEEIDITTLQASGIGIGEIFRDLPKSAP